MRTFNPAKPALLHDQIHNVMIRWLATVSLIQRWSARARPYEDGVMEWEGRLFDGWCLPPAVDELDDG